MIHIDGKKMKSRIVEGFFFNGHAIHIIPALLLALLNSLAQNPILHPASQYHATQRKMMTKNKGGLTYLLTPH